MRYSFPSSLWLTRFLFLWVILSCGLSDASLLARIKTSKSVSSNTGAMNVPITHTLIYGEGHPVYISGASSNSDKTLVWVDENANGVREEDEYIEMDYSVAQYAYVFGGDEDNSISSSVRITMTGGIIGNIYCGGNAVSKNANVSADSVCVTVSGGTVYYIGGGVAQSGYTANITGAVSVNLSDCHYLGGNQIFSRERQTFLTKDIQVVDFSTHNNVSSFFSPYPAFKNYCCPISESGYTMGGHITLSSDIDLTLDSIYVAPGSKIHNLGQVSVTRCHGSGIENNGVWTGHELQMGHQPGTVSYYLYDRHAMLCRECNQTFLRPHVWSYKRGLNGEHTKSCMICDYECKEQCQTVIEYDNELIKRNTCVYCEQKTTEYDHLNQICTCSNSQSVSLKKMMHHDCSLEMQRLQQSDSEQKVAICTTCSGVLPVTLLSGSKSYWFNSLRAACRYCTQQSLTGVTLRLNYDLRSQKTDSLTADVCLDMNGNSVQGPVVVAPDCKIEIINSQAETRYAHFYGKLTNGKGAIVSASGCHFYMLTFNSATSTTGGTYHLGKNMVDRLVLSAKAGHTLSDTLFVVERFSATGRISDCVPVGTVVAERLEDSRWNPLFDYSDSFYGTTIGPGSTSNNPTDYLALLPCAKHELETASLYEIPYQSSQHIGSCVHCGTEVVQPHEYTILEAEHYLRCHVCKEERMKGSHVFGTDSVCVCGTKASFIVRGDKSPNGKYYGSFLSAWNYANEAGYTDTIFMFEDVIDLTVIRGLMLDSQEFYFKNGVRVSSALDADSILAVIPNLYICGNGHKLSFSGMGLKYPYGCEEKVKVCGLTLINSSLKEQTEVAHGNSISSSTDSDGFYTVKKIVHTSHNVKRSGVILYPLNYKALQYGKYNLSYHHSYCRFKCGYESYDSHTYNSNGICSECGVDSTTVYVAELSYLLPRAFVRTTKLFKTLKEAWTQAITVSSERKITTTIRLLGDIELRKEDASMFSLTLDNEGASVILNAKGLYGQEHTLTGWLNEASTFGSSYLLNVKNGSLTIQSGIYKGYKAAVFCGTNGKMTLQGGTFKKGISTGTGVYYEGVSNSAHALGSSLPLGYYMVAEEAGLRTQVGDTIRHGSATICANGTVYACKHGMMQYHEAIEPTCTQMGAVAYGYCTECRSYMALETGNLYAADGFVSAAALGHDFDAQGICTRCGLNPTLLALSGYNAAGDVVLAEQFFASWNEAEEELQNLTKSREDCQTFKLRINGVVPADQPNRLIFAGRNLILSARSMYADTLYLNLQMNDKEHQLTLDGICCRSDSFLCQRLALTNQALLLMDGGYTDKAQLQINEIDIQEGSMLQGIGCSKIQLLPNTIIEGRYDYDPQDIVADMMHHVEVLQQLPSGRWSAIQQGYCAASLGDGCMSLSIHKDGKATNSNCYHWGLQYQSTIHSLNDTTHCNVCGFNLHWQYYLSDGLDYTGLQSRDLRVLTYKRPFSQSHVDVWQSMYLPFELDVTSDLLEKVEIATFSQIETQNSIDFIDVDMVQSGTVIPAYTPCMIRAKETIIPLMIQQLDVKLEAAQNCSVQLESDLATYSVNGVCSQYQDADSRWYTLDETAYKFRLANVSDVLNPFRFYLKVEPKKGVNSDFRFGFRGDPDLITGIEEVRQVDNRSAIYTLDGRKASRNAKPGLYVQRGKKALLKPM